MLAGSNRFASILRMLVDKTPNPAPVVPDESRFEACASEENQASAERRAFPAALPEELALYREAFDAIETGAVLIDGESRVQFVNLAFRRLAGIEPQAVEALVHHKDIARKMYEARGCYRLPDQQEASIADCVASASGDTPKPFQFCFADGTIIRQTCTLLDDGRRLLTYSDITEQAWQREEMEALRAALDEIDFGVVVVDSKLRARFINKAFRRGLDLLDDFADSNPSIVEILEHARRTNALRLSPSEFDEFIKQRLKLIREGRPVLHRMQLTSGPAVQSQILPLPGGSRLLTYAYVKEAAAVTAPELAPQ